MRLRVLKLQKNTRCLIGSILFYILSISLLFSLHFEINIDETQEIGVGLSVEEKKTENEQKHIMMSPQSAAGTSGLLSNFLNTSETCYQQIDWGAAIDGNIEVPTPSEFNSTQLSIDVKVMNATKTTQNIETTTSGTRILEEVAQAFVLPEDCFLTELTIFVAGGQPATRSFEIRKDSPDGETLTSFSASLTDSIWTNLTLSPSIFLTAGKYFLWKAYGAGSGTPRSWARDNAVNNTETYIDLGSGWTAASYDLTLIAYYYNVFNPETVNMQFNGVAVSNTGNGGGHVDLEIPITGSSLTLVKESLSTIKYSYAINATYNRTTQIAAFYRFIDNTPHWNATPSLSDPGSGYNGYHANITGFVSNYYDLQLLNESNSLAYTFLTPEKDVVQISHVADQIKWKSPNILSNPESPSSVFPGGDFLLNITASMFGNVTLRILNEAQVPVLVNSTLQTGLKTVNWTVAPLLDAGLYTLEWVFFTDRQFGYSNRTVELVKLALLTADHLEAFALSSMTFQCALKDMFIDAPLTTSSVSVIVDEITRTMNPSPLNDGTYRATLNLDLFALPPGTYSVYYVADTLGYQQVSTVKNLTINTRPATIRVSQNSNEFLGGESVEFKVIIIDGLSNEQLVRPVSISVRVYEASDQGEGPTVFSEIIPGIAGETTVVWKTPEGLKPGSYSVKVEAQSLYYEGIFTQEGSITIIDPASLESARFRMMITIGAGILIPALSAIIINQNVIKPRKARRLKELEKRTAIFEDMANVNGFILIQKDSGLLVWEYIVNRLKGDSSLVSGFLQALMIFSSQFGITEQSGNPSNLSPQDKQQIEDEMSALSVEHADETKDVLEFNYRDLNYLVVDGEKLRFVCILNTRATDGIIERSRTYIREFEIEQAGFLAKWKGDQDEFIGPAGDMLKRAFPLYLIALYALNSSSNVAEYRSDIFRKKGVVARLFEIIESLMEERGSFKLQTVLRLLDPADRLNAKVALLELIANQIIVEKIVEES